MLNTADGQCYNNIVSNREMHCMLLDRIIFVPRYTVGGGGSYFVCYVGNNNHIHIFNKDIRTHFACLTIL